MCEGKGHDLSDLAQFADLLIVSATLYPGARNPFSLRDEDHLNVDTFLCEVRSRKRGDCKEILNSLLEEDMKSGLKC